MSVPLTNEHCRASPTAQHSVIEMKIPAANGAVRSMTNHHQPVALKPQQSMSSNTDSSGSPQNLVVVEGGRPDRADSPPVRDRARPDRADSPPVRDRVRLDHHRSPSIIPIYQWSSVSASKPSSIPRPTSAPDRPAAGITNEGSAGQWRPSSPRCPFREMGCTSAVREAASVSTHLQTEIHKHSSLLVAWVTKMKSELLRVVTSKSIPASVVCESCTQQPLADGTRTHSPTSATRNADRQTELAQLRRQMASLQRQNCELAQLMRDLRAASEAQTSQLIETNWQHETEIGQIKQLLQSRLDAMQHQLTESSTTSRRSETKPKSFWCRIRRAGDTASKTSVDGLSPTNTLSTVNSEVLDSLREEPTGPAALVWEIGGVAGKIGDRVELWSPYFRPVRGDFTMRLWLRLNEVQSRARVPVELLVWNRDKTKPRLQFESQVIITIRDKLKPFSFRAISKHCSVQEPEYSTVFDFRFAELKQAEVLKHDVVTVECVILCED